jgi:hypothetical protein
LFVNNTLCREAINPEEYKRSVPMELVFTQTKMSSGFTETGMEKFVAAARDLLDLSRDIDALGSVYNSDLLEKIRTFRECYVQLILKFP